jgi:hypothetical protein
VLTFRQLMSQLTTVRGCLSLNFGVFFKTYVCLITAPPSLWLRLQPVGARGKLLLEVLISY